VPFGICRELLEQVSLWHPVRPIPKVVMRVNDRQLRLECGLLGQRKPAFVDGRRE
jgi:hypothetical protein